MSQIQTVTTPLPVDKDRMAKSTFEDKKSRSLLAFAFERDVQRLQRSAKFRRAMMVTFSGYLEDVTETWAEKQTAS